MDGFVKKTALVAAAIVVLVPAAWLGYRFCGRMMEKHLVAQAAESIQNRDYRSATLYLRRALSMNAVDARSYALMADVIEDSGASALNWRIAAVQFATNNVAYRYAWAQTALKEKNFPSAIEALRGIDNKYRTTAKFYILQGGTEWNLRDLPDAEEDFSKALEMEPTNQSVVLDLAAVELASTNNPVLSEKARTALEAFPAGSPLHLTAFRYLITDAVAHKSYDRAILYAQLVNEDPNSTYADRLALLGILKDSNNPRFASWLTTLQNKAADSPEQASTLGHWMQIKQSPAAALQWLQTLPANTQTNLPVPVIVADCHIALHNWTALQALVEKQDWKKLEYYRLLLASLASRKLGNDLAGDAAWQEAFQLAFEHLDRLTKLDEITATWGWTVERAKVLQKISMEFPEQNWANEQLVALYYADGQTRALTSLLNQMSSADPSNARLKSDLATVLLLQKTDPERARRLALESYRSATNNPFCACTYAYSLLLQSKPREAAKIVSSLDPGYLKNPSIAGFYGLVQSAAGDKAAAREPLKLAANGPLLPEEMALVREAVAANP